MTGFEPSDLCKLSIMLNQKPVDAMSFIVHKSQSHKKAKEMVGKLRKILSRQLFEVRIQATINDGKIIASERLAPYRKDVTAKCYGGKQYTIMTCVR